MANQRLNLESSSASPSYQYGSVPCEVPSPCTLETDVNSISSPLPHRGGASLRKYSCVAAMFGFALSLGVISWSSIHTLLESGALDANYEDDDYEHPTGLGWMETVPLLGRPKRYKAQKEALHSLDLLSSRMDINGSNVKVADGCEGTVMIMRHCEKGKIREHCNYQGYERSVYLASQFGEHGRWPAPSHLIAQAPGMRRNPDKRNFREVETILPLSEKFNLEVDTSFSPLDTNKLGRKVLGMMRSGEMCGKLLVVSWKHSKIPKLAHALGCGPEDGCPIKYHGRDFDSLWQLKFVYGKPLHSKRKHLKAPTHKEWSIFGSIQQEGFDPLAFSKETGNYPEGGTSTGGRWRKYDHEIPERKVSDQKSDTKK